MKAIKVRETTRMLAAAPGTEDYVDDLPVHFQEGGITSVWMLSEEDLMKIQNGGNIRLCVLGPHPPVKLWVE